MQKKCKMASQRITRVPSRWRRVAALLLLLSLFLTQFATTATGEPNSRVVRRERGHDRYYRGNTLPVYRELRRRTPSEDESDDLEAAWEHHPADELLQSQDADGSQSYILGGY